MMRRAPGAAPDGATMVSDGFGRFDGTMVQYRGPRA